MGTFHADTGKFDLVIAFDYDPTAPGVLVGEVGRWKAAFAHASSLLYAATDGQHQLGRLYVCPYGTGKDAADAWLLGSGGSSSADGRIWLPGTHMLLANDEQHRPFVILHELGHYLYGLRDEYKNTAGAAAACLGRDAANKLPGACIMEGRAADGDRFGDGGSGGDLVAGEVTDFCVACNHDKGGPTTCGSDAAPTSYDAVADDTVQSTTYGKSCWETMADHYPDLVPPGLLPDPGPEGGPDPVTWIELIAETRCVLALDRSGTFAEAAPRAWHQAKAAVCDWIDMAYPDDRLGVVAYDHRVVEFGLFNPTPSSRRQARAQVMALEPRGTTNMYGALRAAGTMIRSAGPRATTQVVILMSGSRHDTGPEPLLLLPRLRANGIRVYGIAIGPEADVGRLAALAEGTGGRWGQIPANPFAGVTMRLVMQWLFAETHEGGGVITADAGATVPWDPALPGLPDGGDTEFDVPVEQGCELVSVTALWEGGGEARFDLRAPDGRRITPMTRHDDVRQALPDRSFALNEIRNPQPGKWRARLAVGGAAAAKAAAHVVATVRSRRVRLTVSTARTVYSAGEDVRIVAQVAAPLPVEGLRFAAHVEGPDGRKAKLDLVAEKGSGIHAASFRPEEPGTYAVKLVADNREGKASVAPGVDTAAAGRSRSGKVRVPRFVRNGELVVRVLERPTGRARARPDSLAQGKSALVRVEFGGRPWIPGTSTLHAGPGVRFVEQLDRPREEDAAWFTVEVARHAPPGPRDGILRTADATRVLEGLIRIEGKPVRSKVSPGRKTRPGRFLREHLAKRGSRVPEGPGRDRF